MPTQLEEFVLAERLLPFNWDWDNNALNIESVLHIEYQFRGILKGDYATLLLEVYTIL